MASANLSSMLNLGSVVFLRNCHADFRAGSPEYPIRFPSSTSDRPDFLNSSRARSIVFRFLECMEGVYHGIDARINEMMDLGGG